MVMYRYIVRFLQLLLCLQQWICIYINVNNKAKSKIAKYHNMSPYTERRQHHR
jgi:hypothetical protein